MARCIDIDDLIERIKNFYKKKPGTIWGKKELLELFDNARKNLSFDIVYCKDCKYHSCDEFCCKHLCNRAIGCTEVFAKDFCSYGERK